MKRLIAAAVAVSLAYGLGCSDSEGTESTANGDIETFEANYRKYVEASCECEFRNEGFSPELCVDAYLELDKNTSCERNAVSRPEAADTLACASEGWLIAADCVAEGPCDIEHWDGCLDKYIEHTRDCEWPDAVQEEFEACPRPESFECLGGGSVDIAVVCDYVDDCEDGSDEIPC